MGGRVALYYAVYGKCSLSKLIIESSSPGIKDENNRHERQQIDAKSESIRYWVRGIR